jgi:ABC-type polysaccharide transport system permease subunit
MIKDFFYSTDKLLHILVNVLIVSILSLFIGTLSAVIIAAMVSVFKESYD